MANSRKCVQCGDEFEGSGNQKYCTLYCREYAFKIRSSIRNGFSPYQIYLRDGFRCVYCGSSSVLDGVRLHLDHVVPVSYDGKDSIDNIVSACINCNSSKNNKRLPDHLESEIIEYIKEKNKEFHYLNKNNNG